MMPQKTLLSISRHIESLDESLLDKLGVRLENGKYPTLRLFFVRFDIDIA